MRAGLSTIQQTLTPEAGSVLNHAIAEAGRRSHGQTTPLHVAATLLASPTGFLRQACIRSHPNSSHPLQCRALELCFSVALDRLPSAQSASPTAEPPVSNALMAALKRAQAHQRRGCPEQQQQPLLAVKVELEQLIISILDDPSVSRVMREASFSSPAVKATIEQTLTAAAPPPQSIINPSSSPIGFGFRPMQPGRNIYLNPRLQQQQQQPPQSRANRGDEVKRIVEILMRTEKRNPVLVGDSEPEAVMRELVSRIEKREVGGEGGVLLNSAQLIPLEPHLGQDRTLSPSRLKDLGDLIQNRMEKLSGGAIVLDLGDLKWLVEQPPGLNGPVTPEAGRAAVVEMGKLLSRFAGGRFWLMGTATCETYLRCQVYHPSMEKDWDLQAVPIATRAPLPGFTRFGNNGIMCKSIENLNPMKGPPAATTALQRSASENKYLSRRTSRCPQCTESYEKELAKLMAEEFEKSSVIKSEAAKSALPPWLQNAKAPNQDANTADELQEKHQELLQKQKTLELQKKWADTCMHHHPHLHQSFSSEGISLISHAAVGLYRSNLAGRQTFQPKLQVQKNIEETLQLNSNPVEGGILSELVSTPPRSPVRTDLVLGQTKTSEAAPEESREERVIDLLGCINSEPKNNFEEFQSQKLFNTLDADSFKRLLKGLMQKVAWQQDAASSVAATVTKCKSGNGKCRGGASRGDVWLMFTGPDRVGKRKMASALSELICGSSPVMLCLGSRNCHDKLDGAFRGKTTMDRIVEAVRRNPMSLIMIEDVDEADTLVCGNIKRAMERGRLIDSHGREVSLGNAIFILTTEWLPENASDSTHSLSHHEEKLARVASGNWQLRLSASRKNGKRRANWLGDEERRTKIKNELASTLSFDLNMAADAADEEGADGSRNSSDLTVDHEDERVLEIRRSPTASSPSRQFLSSIDDAIVFKPVDFSPIRRDIACSITSHFSSIIGEALSIEIEDEALERILGGMWLGQTGVEDWAERVLVPGFLRLKAQLSPSTSDICDVVVRLESENNCSSRICGDWLPNKINVMVDELGG